MPIETRSGVLIVDDDSAYAQALRTSLTEHLSTDVDVVSCAADALAAMYSRRYQLVIADLRLPDASGSGLIRDAEAQGLLIGTTVFIITANGLLPSDGPQTVPVLEKRDLEGLVRQAVARVSVKVR